jgi:hypothetical protein
MSSLTCLLAALVYTTVASGGPAAQGGQAQFTEQSSDVRTRYLADIAAVPGLAGPPGPLLRRLRRQAAGQRCGSRRPGGAPIRTRLPALAHSARAGRRRRPFWAMVEKGAARRTPVENLAAVG